MTANIKHSGVTYVEATFSYVWLISVMNHQLTVQIILFPCYLLCINNNLWIFLMFRDTKNWSEGYQSCFLKTRRQPKLSFSGTRCGWKNRTCTQQVLKRVDTLYIICYLSKTLALPRWEHHIFISLKLSWCLPHNFLSLVL